MIKSTSGDFVNVGCISGAFKSKFIYYSTKLAAYRCRYIDLPNRYKLTNWSRVENEFAFTIYNNPHASINTLPVNNIRYWLIVYMSNKDIA